ncbi:Fur family transcriptional regulator, partial [Xanthovirga aplysinae]|uniref:Fur family transcriptional regulator n=1 Tax=Xanthovirga aplysinae TaxID=2529853 RepID=UPI0012BCE70C
MTPSDLLKDYSLRFTTCRVEVLKIFLEQLNALSHSDIEDKLTDSFDRVTLYRTLKTFVNKGILHKIPDDSGIARYALCKEEYCSTDQHDHEHVHFKCIKCEMTTCLEEVKIPPIFLPK